jgi:hypothetical protein
MLNEPRGLPEDQFIMKYVGNREDGVVRLKPDSTWYPLYNHIFEENKHMTTEHVWLWKIYPGLPKNGGHKINIAAYAVDAWAYDETGELESVDVGSGVTINVGKFAMTKEEALTKALAELKEAPDANGTV